MANEFHDWRKDFQSDMGRRLFHFLARTMHRIPLRAAYGVGHLLGRMGPWLSPHQFQKVVTDITRAFGDTLSTAEVDLLARRSTMRLSESIIEFLRLPHMSKDEIQRWARLEQQEHIEAAMQAGKGAILLSAHLGNWELCATLVGLTKYQITAVARPQDDTAFTNLLNKMRETHGVKVIPMTDVRGCIRVLQRNECLGILGDLNARIPGAFINVFGHPAATFSGVAYLAHTTGAPILAAFDERLPDNTHRVVMSPPIPLVSTGDKQKDIFHTSIRVQQVIEENVARRPEDWYWLLHRWYTRPEDVPNPERIPMEHRDLTPDESAAIRGFTRGWLESQADEQRAVLAGGVKGRAVEHPGECTVGAHFPQASAQADQ
jgi:KDO2-lipid IV(A) lauroyltransferase